MWKMSGNLLPRGFCIPAGKRKAFFLFVNAAAFWGEWGGGAGSACLWSIETLAIARAERDIKGLLILLLLLRKHRGSCCSAQGQTDRRIWNWEGIIPRVRLAQTARVSVAWSMVLFV